VLCFRWSHGCSLPRVVWLCDGWFLSAQVHCVRNKKGEIVEGSESEIRRIHYVWAMVRHFSEDLAEPPTWKLHEMGIEYQAPLLA